MTKTRRVVVDECHQECPHEPWPWLGKDWEIEDGMWHLCPVFLATKGRGRVFKVEPLVFANYDDETGIFVRASEVDSEVTLALAEKHGYTIKDYVPVICAWPTGWHRTCGAGSVSINGTRRKGARSVYGVDLSEIQRALPKEIRHWWPFGSARSLSWFETKGRLGQVFYGVCRRHLPNIIGIRRKNRSYTKVRDFQRSKVYRWEEEAFPDIRKLLTTLDECLQLVHTVWDAHAPDEAPPPQVILGRSKWRSDANSKKIRLSPNTLNPIVTIHETAHALLGAAGRCAKHGPLFVRLYVELLERYAGETPEPAQNLKVASYEELAAVDNLRGFEIAEKAA